MKLRAFALGLVLLFVFGSTWARPHQPDSVAVPLSPQELGAFKERAQQMIGELQTFIAIIADKSKSYEERNEAIKSAMRLFNSDATMQVSNLNRKKDFIRTMPVRQYFENLKNIRASRIEITNYQPIVVGEWQRQPDGTYVATGQYFQEFRSWKGGVPAYVDRTQKIVDLGLGYWQDPFFKDHRWMVLLGNVKVESTEAPPGS
jgi:hypothetical protein